MAGGSRSQKQAARAVRRKQEVAARKQAERLAGSLPGRVAAAAACPVERCLRTAGLFEAGIGHVIVARSMPGGRLGCAFFLVDVLCLGVKDAFYRDLAPFELEERGAALEAEGQVLQSMDPAAARKLVTGAAAFAASLGLDQARDYPTLSKVFGDASSSPEVFAFGRDGRPVYFPGENDSMTRIREVQRALDRKLGQDGWDFAPIRDDPRARPLMAAVELLRGRADGPVVEHEGSARPR